MRVKHPAIASMQKKQSGAALIVSLILLSVLTILAVSASQSTRMQERMAGNARNVDIAFQAAEAGARNGERYLAGLTSVPDACSTAPCPVLKIAVLPLDMSDQNDTWWTTNGREYGTASQELTGPVEDPRYVIEEIGRVPDDLTAGGGPPSERIFYRATARAKGGTAEAITVVQTTYTRRF
jgi:type IV pilus assembly protein PilX